MKHYQYTMTDGVRRASICTPHGTIALPTFMPVTTFGTQYPLDQLIRPYLPRLSQCIMVSHFYAQEMKERPNMPVFIDSGGFASMFEGSEIIEHEDHACIKSKDGDELDPVRVLTFQEKHADIGATLDFIIPPGCAADEAERRFRLTLQNAFYVKERVSAPDFMLYGSLQCWDVDSARTGARQYAQAGFEGIAIGGMVPHAKDVPYMESIVRAVREEAPDCAIHVFGCGNPETIPTLIQAGADSFDSSSYIRSAVDARTSANGRACGIQTGLYSAICKLYEVNSATATVATAITETIPNVRLCLPQYQRSEEKDDQ